MGKMRVGWPIYSDAGDLYTPVRSLGSWQATLPLSNLGDRQVTKVARSTNALAASTKYEIDLGAARPIGLIALVALNLTSTGTVRVQGGASSGVYSYDSTATVPYPAGQTAETLAGLNLSYVHIPATVQTYRYWLVEIVDTGNPDGFVEFGRDIFAKAWDPTYDINYGAEFGIEDDTIRTVTRGGAALYDEGRRRRWAKVSQSGLPESDAVPNVLNMQRIAGTNGQAFFVWDDTDPYMWLRSFLAVARSLSALQMRELARYNVGHEWIEEL